MLGTWRAASRQHDDVILIELDGVDQAKFAWPRSEVFSSKDLAQFKRPRLHVTGLICHGWFRHVYVSEADRKKNGNYTCYLLAHAITRLQSRGAEPHRKLLRVNLDNTARENKNQFTMRMAMWLVSTNRVGAVSFSFLRTGHTHELIDQWLGQMCGWLRKQASLPTPSAFVASLNAWCSQQALQSRHESYAGAFKVDDILAWADYLQPLQVVVEGTGGPQAAHEFIFRKQGQQVPQQVQPNHLFTPNMPFPSKASKPHNKHNQITSWKRTFSALKRGLGDNDAGQVELIQPFRLSHLSLQMTEISSCT